MPVHGSLVFGLHLGNAFGKSGSGFDYTSAQRTQSSSIQAVGALWDVDLWDVGVWGGQNAVQVRMYTSGRGNVFSLKIRNATASQGFTIQGASVRLKTDKARKDFTAV